MHVRSSHKCQSHSARRVGVCGTKSPETGDLLLLYYDVVLRKKAKQYFVTIIDGGLIQYREAGGGFVRTPSDPPLPLGSTWYMYL